MIGAFPALGRFGMFAYIEARRRPPIFARSKN
jgi:hypothetical protein